MSKTAIESLADSIERWADVAAGFVFGVVAMSFVNVAISLYSRARG